MPAEHEERAAYVVEGSVKLLRDGGTFGAGQLLVFKPGEEIVLAAPKSSPVRVMLLGGEPMDGKRHIFWNFVSSSKERIEQARKTGRRAGSPQCRASQSSSRCRRKGQPSCGIPKYSERCDSRNRSRPSYDWLAEHILTIQLMGHPPLTCPLFEALGP